MIAQQVFEVGQSVEFKTITNPETGSPEIIQGKIGAHFDNGTVSLVLESGDIIMVHEDNCVATDDCGVCGGSGHLIIPARQVYSKEKGVHIQEEADYKCKNCDNG